MSDLPESDAPPPGSPPSLPAKPSVKLAAPPPNVVRIPTSKLAIQSLQRQRPSVKLPRPPMPLGPDALPKIRAISSVPRSLPQTASSPAISPRLLPSTKTPNPRRPRSVSVPTSPAANRTTSMLWDNRSLQRTLLDHLDLGLALLSNDGAILTANRALHGMLGYRAPELKGVIFTDLIDQSDGEPPLPLTADPHDADRRRAERCFWRKEGGMVWASLTVTRVAPEDDSHPELLMVVFENITARKLMQERLARAQAQYRALVDFQSELVYRLAPDGTLRFVNEAFCRIFGGHARNLHGRSFFELLDPSEAPKVRESLGNLSLSRREQSTRIKLRFADAEFRWLQCSHRGVFTPSGELGEIQGVAHDVTDQVSAERARALLFAATESAGEAIYITGPTNLIEYCNEACEWITGYSRNDLLGREPKVFKSNPDDESLFERIRNALASGETWKGRSLNKRKDGTIYEADEVVSPFVDELTGTTHSVAVMRDVSNEVALERQLHHGQKMEALGMLAGGIAHDFNNLLAIVMMYSAAALDAIPEDRADLRGRLAEIEKAAKRGRDLVLDLMAFSRKSDTTAHSPRRPLFLGTVVSEAVRMIQPTLPENIRVRSQIDKTNSKILAEPSQIHQVVVNLCNNAVHAMKSQGGALTVEVERVPLDPSMFEDASESEETEFVRLTVADNGTGMSSETISRMFEPFYTTKKPGEGTGLGLANVKNIVTSHGGGIHVESTPGQGTVFRVYFPSCDDSPVAADSEDTLQLPWHATGREHILYVDDEPALAQAGHLTLTQLGYQVTVATSALEGLDLFRSKPETFDLIISDFHMPKLNGEELAREIFKVRPEMPVILVSGYSALVTQERAQKLGVRLFLNKPFGAVEISEAIRWALDGTPPSQSNFGSPGSAPSTKTETIPAPAPTSTPKSQQAKPPGPRRETDRTPPV